MENLNDLPDIAHKIGIELRNLDRASELLGAKRPPRGKSVDFMVSALQSALFNC